MADKIGISSELSRELTLFQITMMGLGMMIGAGVFLGIGNSIYIAGPGGVLLTFTLNGVIAMFTALSYAELSSAIPRAGGAYNYARIGFGRGTSFLAGWMEWFASSAAGSLYSITFATYILHFLGGFKLFDDINMESHILMKAVALTAALVFIYINYRGASETGTAGSLMAVGQTITLAVVAIAITVGVLWQNNRPVIPKEATWDDVVAEARRGGYQLISTKELWERYGRNSKNLLLVDTRQEWEYRTGHIKGALIFPIEPTWLSRWRKKGELKTFLGPDKNRFIVFY